MPMLTQFIKSPIVRKTGEVIHDEFFKGSAGILDDLQNRVNLRDSLNSRGENALSSIKKRVLDGMGGEGYNKTIKRIKRGQSSIKRTTKKKSKKLAVKKKKSNRKVKKTKKAVKTSKHTFADYFG